MWCFILLISFILHYEHIYVVVCLCSLTFCPAVSFLVTASAPTYVVVMNGSAAPVDRNLTGLNKGLDEIVFNGTPCDVNVSYSMTPSCKVWSS